MTSDEFSGAGRSEQSNGKKDPGDIVTTMTETTHRLRFP